MADDLQPSNASAPADAHAVEPIKPKRLALTIAGAVSLGSYEAGVMWETLDALAQHDQGRGPNNPDRIVVDVATGASAGGMTAIILANKLLYAGSEFRGPYDNPLYDTWVKRINLQDLQKPGPQENPLHSLLSSDLIVSISQDTLLRRYQPGGGAGSGFDLHGSIDQFQGKENDRLRFQVGVALTNLDGVDYGVPVRGASGGDTPHDKFIYREYADQRTKTIDKNSDTKDFWEPLRQVAVACGAFPVAFRPQDVERSAKKEVADYPKTDLEQWPADPQTFTYSDGGILQNQPLGIAKNLVDELDEHQHQDSRYYLFVSPHSKDGGSRDTFHEVNADYFHLAKQLVKVVMGQAQFRDWITAEGVNERVYLMDTRAKGLMQGIVGGVVNVDALQQTANAVIEMMFKGKAMVAPGAKEPEDAEAARERLRSQYAAEVKHLADDGKPGAVESFLDSMVAFEAAAGLGARDMMKIYGVTAKDSELSGAGIESFLGFFDQRYRDHDYDVGRAHAREFLLGKAADEDCPIGPIRFDPNRFPLRPIDRNLDGIGIADVDPGVLQGFEMRLKDRVDAMVDKLVQSTVRNKALKWIVDKVISEAFRLWRKSPNTVTRVFHSAASAVIEAAVNTEGYKLTQDATIYLQDRLDKSSLDLSSEEKTSEAVRYTGQLLDIATKDNVYLIDGEVSSGAIRLAIEAFCKKNPNFYPFCKAK